MGMLVKGKWQKEDLTLFFPCASVFWVLHLQFCHQGTTHFSIEYRSRLILGGMVDHNFRFLRGVGQKPLTSYHRLGEQASSLHTHHSLRVV